MKQLLLAPILFLTVTASAVAQQASDAPASKEDIQRYLQAMHSHEMMRQVAEAMAKPMHKMVYDEFQKNKEKLPPDFETRMTKYMDEMFAQMPWDEMLDATIPVYQKHLSKGDVDALIAFYGSPTGQKMLREMPAMMADAMQSMMPIMQREMEKATNRLQEEMAQMLHERQKSAQPSRQSVKN